MYNISHMVHDECSWCMRQQRRRKTLTQLSVYLCDDGFPSKSLLVFPHTQQLSSCIDSNLNISIVNGPIFVVWMINYIRGCVCLLQKAMKIIFHYQPRYPHKTITLKHEGEGEGGKMTIFPL